MTAPGAGGASRILVLNAGSSSLKASLIARPAREPLARVTIELGADARLAESLPDAVTDVLARLGGPHPDAGPDRATTPEAVGHRVVHGGTRFVAPVLVSDAVEAALDEMAELAPLHNPVAVASIRAARAALPDVPHVAAFDTAFHATLPEAARRYPLPPAWHDDWGVRRFGFHGLAVEWDVRRAAELLFRPAEELRLVVAHLGSGCSVTAVDGGRSVATSMGMTPLEGLMMGTRAGSIDPGIVLEVLQAGRLTLVELGDVLEGGAGLLGVSGSSSDVRVLEAAADAGDDRAALALELFVASAAAGIGAAATALPALDAIVFSGGIGEHAARIRARIVARLAPLGVAQIDAKVSDEGSAGQDRVLSAASAGPRVLRVEAREDLVIADAVAACLADPA